MAEEAGARFSREEPAGSSPDPPESSCKTCHEVQANSSDASGSRWNPKRSKPQNAAASAAQQQQPPVQSAVGSWSRGRGRPGRARLPSAGLGSAHVVSAGLGSVRLISFRLGSAPLGSVRLNSFGLGWARLRSGRGRGPAPPEARAGGGRGGAGGRGGGSSPSVERRGCPGASQAGSGAEAAAASPLAAGRGAGSRPSPRRPVQPRPLPAAPGAAGAAGDCLPLVAVRRRPAGTAETCGCGEKGVSAGCPRRDPPPPGVSLTAWRRWRAAPRSCPGVLGSPRGKRPVKLRGGRQRHFQSSHVPLALLLPSLGWEKGGRPRKQVKRRKEVSESAAVEETVKRRRVEVGAEASCPQSGMGRTGAKCVRHTSKAKHGFETNSSKENEREFSPASLTVGCNRVGLWAPVGSNLEQRAGTGQAEGAVQLLQQLDQMVNKGNVESEGRGLSRFWRSIIFSPLQHLLLERTDLEVLMVVER
ncbi:translation initiation factor IF-2-like [Aquila chrysaetos chrysaetos]|uniref:translation initiation factor IF-2-like n=1 Tax=Aquila chrysaetos chrysaetos TaxID=223781 RepID=UPI0011772448|nr:translation initiation factor IF-2-like [Aquila chrysaetos chrysaetos]